MNSDKISLKFVPKGPINNIPAFVQIMAWCRPGDKPLSEPMMVALPMHICVTQTHCINFSSIQDEEPDLFKAQSSGSEPVRLKRIGVDLTQFGHFWILTAIDYRSW